MNLIDILRETPGTMHVEIVPIIINGKPAQIITDNFICDMCQKPIIDIQSAKRYDFYLEDDEVKDVPFETKYLCPECEAELNKPKQES